MNKIEWNVGNVNGTSFSGLYLDVADLGGFASVTDGLVALGGEDDGPSDKTTHEFHGRFDGNVFTLYDYKGDHEYHIGCHQRGSWLDELKALLREKLPAAIELEG